jgi:hypothetical protein
MLDLPKEEKRIFEQWSGPPLRKRMVVEYFVKCDKCGGEISAPTLARLRYLFEAHYSFSHLRFADRAKEDVKAALKK